MEKTLPLTDALFYVLLALREPKHGYGIIQEVEKLTKGRLVLGAGTLYGALNLLSERGWIEIYSQQTSSRKKKEYIITPLGRAAFQTERQRLCEMLENSRLMDGKEEEI